MNVLVLGAGVAGLATAQRLARDGHKVRVLDRRRGVALEGSYANGGQLSYDFAEPMAAPGVPQKIPSWIRNAQSPIRVDLQWDWRQWVWMLRFVRACSHSRHIATMERLMALGAASRLLMAEFIEQHEDALFDWRQTGKLAVYSSQSEFLSAQRLVARKREMGAIFEIQSRDACVAREPALRSIAGRIVGGVFAPKEETANCHRFCTELYKILKEPPYGVTFELGTKVTKLIKQGTRITGVETPHGSIDADQVVLAVGRDAAELTRPLGYEPLIYPVKGYSVTLPITDDTAAPRLSVTDVSYRIVYARMGMTMRVAGMADIGDRSPDFTEGRLSQMVTHARQCFPKASHFETIDPWCGLRPCTPDGWPVLGRAPRLDNLYFNMGHGTLGFTMAMGAGQVIADLIAGRAVDPLFV